MLVTSLDEMIAKEEQIFLGRVPKSIAMHQTALRHIPGGVASSWASSRPTPVWVEYGKGAHVWDVDGNKYVDFHAGYGANVVGHANPAVVAAVQNRVTLGTHFAQPTPDVIVVAEALADRFGLPQWRFCNSGSEATMDAVHLMRVASGRDLIIKIEGSYNGHHDSVLVSIFRSTSELGPENDPWRVPGAGVPQAIADLVRIVPYNDLVALEKLLVEFKNQIAGMILEPMMMNAGIIAPLDGYLQGLRELTRKHGVLLAFDEVKTGLVVHHGGATKLYGVQPDIVCLAKALGGGVPCGAIGGTAEVMSVISDGRYSQVGTFNGNPLTMAAAKAVLVDVLKPSVYAEANELGAYILNNALDTLHRHGQPAYGFQAGFKVCVVFSDQRAKNYREFLNISTGVSHLHFLKQFNGGIFLPPWGKSESLTLSVAHTKGDADIYIENLVEFGQMLGSMGERDSKVFAVGSFN